MKSTRAHILMTQRSIDILEADLSLSENNQPLLRLCTTARPHNGVVISKHNAQCSAEVHHLSEWLLQRSCHPPPAHIQPSHAPLCFLWKTQSNEGMDCAMNGSWCVIFTFPHLHWCFITIAALQDQIRRAMWQLDMTSPPPTHTHTLSDVLHPSFHMLASRGDNERKIITHAACQGFSPRWNL